MNNYVFLPDDDKFPDLFEKEAKRIKRKIYGRKTGFNSKNDPKGIKRIMKQTLYIITGLPFAGKTTLTKELLKRFNFEVASVDEMIDKHNFVVEKMSYADWEIVYDAAFEKLEELLKEGKSVVFDGGSLKKSERQNLKKVAEKLGVPWKLIYVNTTKKEIVKRRKENLDSKRRDQLEDKTMDRALAMFEKPTPDENYIIFNSHIELDKLLH